MCGGTGGGTATAFDERNKTTAVPATATEEMNRRIVPIPTGILSKLPATNNAATPMRAPSEHVLTPDIPAIFLARVLRTAIATTEATIVTNSRRRNMVAAMKAVTTPTI